MCITSTTYENFIKFSSVVHELQNFIYEYENSNFKLDILETRVF